MTTEINKNAVKDYLASLQSEIVESVQIVDGENFLIDSWQRKEGGGGTTSILECVTVFEWAGIGF